MLLEVDFNSDQAIYIQLRNQIIVGIACSDIQDGESLPSVRQLAQILGVNMHTVNKAYAILRQKLGGQNEKITTYQIFKPCIGGGGKDIREAWSRTYRNFVSFAWTA